MKKVLVTGGAGTIGLQVIRFLLSEGKYDVTVLELKSRHTYRRLKKYRKRISIVYGDVKDSALVDALIKENEFVIHLAGVLPPFANLKEEYSRILNYNGTENIVRAIKDYNPKCHLFYCSSTSVYGKVEGKEVVNVKTVGKISDFDYYSKYALECEELIQKSLNNYTIFRASYVLCDVRSETVIYTVPKDSMLEAISSEDAGYAFVAAIDNRKALNKKIFNLTGGAGYTILFRDYLVKVLDCYGLSLRYITNNLFADKDYNCHLYSDSEKLNDILNFRSKNIDLYYDTLEIYKHNIFRLIPRLLAKPFVWKLKMEKNKKWQKKED